MANCTPSTSQSMRATEFMHPHEMALRQVPPLSVMIQVVVPWTEHNAEKAMRDICELDPWRRHASSSPLQYMSCQQKRLESFGDYLNLAMRAEEPPCRKRYRAAFERHQHDTQFLEASGRLQSLAWSYLKQFWEHWRAWKNQQQALKPVMDDPVLTAELKATGPPQAATVNSISIGRRIQYPAPGFTITRWDQMSGLVQGAVHKRNEAIQAVNDMTGALEELAALVHSKDGMPCAARSINAQAQNSTAPLAALLQQRDRQIQQLSTVPVHNVDNGRTEALQLGTEDAIADAKRRHELGPGTSLAHMVQREQQQLQVKEEMVQEMEDDKDDDLNTMTAFTIRLQEAIERLTALCEKHGAPHDEIAAAARIETHRN